MNEHIERITEIQDRIIYLENNDNTDDYNDFLDESCSEIVIGNLRYAPSEVLKSVDPTAYRCGINDYNDDELNELNDELRSLE